jgi:hypothetical protein
LLGCLVARLPYPLSHGTSVSRDSQKNSTSLRSNLVVEPSWPILPRLPLPLPLRPFSHPHSFIELLIYSSQTLNTDDLCSLSRTLIIVFVIRTPLRCQESTQTLMCTSGSWNALIPRKSLGCLQFDGTHAYFSGHSIQQGASVYAFESSTPESGTLLSGSI